MKKFFQFVFILTLFIVGIKNVAFAEDIPTTIHLTIRAGEVFFSEDVLLSPDSTVLSILEAADVASEAFIISDIQEYPFGSYLKCINIQNIGEKCDNWQYTIDNDYPSTSIDQTPLSGVGSVYLYFSAKNKISLNNDTLTTSDTLVVTIEKYDYESGEWLKEDTATVGVTQPDTSGSFNPPTEIMTGDVDENGQISFTSIPVGIYDVGIRDEYGYYFPTKPVTIIEAPTPTSYGSSGGSKQNKTEKSTPEEIEIKPDFNLQKAFEFIISQQKEDGSFGEELYTDWVALALATTQNYTKETIKLVKYFGELTTPGTTLTDFERHAMALMSLGLNPYNTNGENYIEKIVTNFDGKQFGNPNETNDDIFALIVLQNAGYTKEDKMIRDDISFILGAQEKDGSWNKSVDMTGAAIQALIKLSPTQEVVESLGKAKNFLKEKQKENGGWNDSASSTAWTLQGILGMSEKTEDWKKNENSPFDYLATIQDSDGGIKNENLQNKIWETAYVIAALSNKNWSQIMQKFEKSTTSTTSKEQPSKNPPRTALKNLKPKQENLANQTASVINTAPQINEPTTIENTGWFIKLIGTIFNIF